MCYSLLNFPVFDGINSVLWSPQMGCRPWKGGKCGGGKLVSKNITSGFLLVKWGNVEVVHPIFMSPCCSIKGSGLSGKAIGLRTTEQLKWVKSAFTVQNLIVAPVWTIFGESDISFWWTLKTFGQCINLFNSTSEYIKKQLHWLPIPARIQFKLMTTTWKAIKLQSTSSNCSKENLSRIITSKAVARCCWVNQYLGTRISLKTEPSPLLLQNSGTIFLTVWEMQSL